MITSSHSIMLLSIKAPKTSANSHLAQERNAFLRSHYYEKLTPRSFSCPSRDLFAGPGVSTGAFGASGDTIISWQNGGFLCVIVAFSDVRNGAFAIYFGPDDLFDALTIERTRVLLSVALITLVASLCSASKAFANDTFPGTTITGSNGTFTGTVVGATGQAGEPNITGGNLNTMWYSWTAPASGVFVAGTCNPTASTTTNFDTTLGAYTGAAVNALTALNTNDDTTGCNSTVNANYGSTVTFAAVSGTTYRLQVDGYQNNTGTFHLHYGLVGINVATTDASATEGGDTAAFTVALTTVPTANVTVTIGASTQCTFSSSTLTFTLANWNTPQTVTATATNDAVVEGVHSCAPASITATGGSFNTATGTPPTLTVNDNDVGTIVIATTDNAATETVGNTGAFTAVLGLQPSANVTVTVGTSTQCTFAPSALTFTTANWNVAQPVVATPVDDAIVEGPHTCSPASITAAGGGYTGVTGTSPTINITDNDAATVSIANTTNGAEAGPVNGVMTVTQTAVSATNTVVAYSVTGTATSGADFTALSGTLTVIAGATTATISIPVINDLVVDPAETVIITMTSVSSGLATLGSPAAATNTIADNDVASFSIAKGVNAANISTPVTLAYTITIANTGNIPLTAPVITDALTQTGPLTLTSGPSLSSGDAAPLGTLDVGETWIYSASYAVTQGNIDIGVTISNTATFDTAETPQSSSLAATTTITQSPAMTVVKSAVPGGPVSTGDIINYAFRVRNTGNITINAVTLSDTFNGYGAAPVPDNEALSDDVAPLGDSSTGTANDGIWAILAPGDEVIFTAPYTVVLQDVELLQ